MMSMIDARPAIDSVDFRRLVESAPFVFLVHDERGVIIDANARAREALKDGRRPVVGRSVFDLLFPDLPEARTSVATLLPGVSLTLNGTVRNARGVKHEVAVVINCEASPRGMLFLAMLDTSREAERRQEHERLTLAAHVGSLGVWDYDITRDVLHCDPQWRKIMGLREDQPIRSIGEFKRLIHPDDVDRATEVDATAAELIARKQDYAIAFRIIRPDGEVRWVRSAACVIEDAAGAPTRAVGFVVDITDTWLESETLRRANRALRQVGVELARQALRDPLTGIANRRLLDIELEQACRHVSEVGGSVALAMIDVDFFKNYNDRYGHAMGDTALRSVADALTASVREGQDIHARFGGEEFAIIFYDVREVEFVIERIFAEVAALKIPNEASSISPILTVSCGCVVVAGRSETSPESLLGRSDENLYLAKSEGRNRYVISAL